MLAQIVLVGEDGISQHASGKINADICEEYKLVERNGHVYAFEHMIGTHRTVAQYRECKTPYRIMEF